MTDEYRKARDAAAELEDYSDNPYLAFKRGADRGRAWELQRATDRQNVSLNSATSDTLPALRGECGHE